MRSHACMCGRAWQAQLGLAPKPLLAAAPCREMESEGIEGNCVTLKLKTTDFRVRAEAWDDFQCCLSFTFGSGIGPACLPGGAARCLGCACTRAHTHTAACTRTQVTTHARTLAHHVRTPSDMLPPVLGLLASKQRAAPGMEIRLMGVRMSGLRKVGGLAGVVVG